jgi:hypothetical protein
MKLLLVTFLAFFMAIAAADRLHEAELVIKGILEGSFGAVGEEVVECIQDGELIFEDIKHAIQDFEEAVVSKNKEKLVEALQYIGEALKLMPEEIKDCEGAEAVVEDLIKIAEEFSNPISLVIDIGEKIIWHGRSIYHDVSGAVDDFRQEEYENAGKDIGDIIKIVFLNGLTNPVEDADHLLTHFYKAAFNLKLDLDTCKTEIESSVDELVAGVNHLMHISSVEDAIAAVKEVVAGAEDLYHSSQDCTTAWPVIEEGLEDMRPFVEHPAKIVLAIAEAVALDPIAFPKDAYNLYTALSGDHVDFDLTGDASGDMIRMILKHM